MSKISSQPLYRHPALVVAPSKYGLGVFAADDIPADTTLEECHHLRIEEQNCLGIVNDYVYGLESEQNDSEEDNEYYSLPLGCGSIFNHAEDQNTEYWHDTDRDLIVFHTIKDIHAGEQLFINYGREWWDTRERTPDNDLYLR
jgi:SET domain-containing protein